ASTQPDECCWSIPVGAGCRGGACCITVGRPVVLARSACAFIANYTAPSFTKADTTGAHRSSCTTGRFALPHQRPGLPAYFLIQRRSYILGRPTRPNY